MNFARSPPITQHEFDPMIPITSFAGKKVAVFGLGSSGLIAASALFSGGADVVGIDLAPVLIETARERARKQLLKIDYRVGDCERLEGLDDASFDVASSTCGIMFAPDHEATAHQLARVVRPGGRIGQGAVRRRLRKSLAR